ncbi:MAG: acetyl-CoA synthetase [Dehalococcoidia bacterium SM23_28_2]|nr:MAG: acetyl-CoA synthetase [Dehalococcoidia bacterium SM23_28_2]
MSAIEIIDKAKSEGRTILTEVESKQILAEEGIPVAHAQLAATREEAMAAARQIGLPVAIKIVSPDITHKSDVGGVKLGLNSEEEVAAAFDEIVETARRAQPKAAVLGVSVQKMARPGVEVIMGMTTDPQFGPVLMFGLGGVFVEVLKDVAFRIVPLEARDARQMIRDIQGFPVLEGFRGQEPADLAALENMLMRLSAFVEEHPEIQELDLNPIFAYKDGALAVDARIVLS